MALRTLTTLAAGPLGAADDGGKLLAAIRGNPKFCLEGVSGDGKGWRLKHADNGPHMQERTVASRMIASTGIDLGHGSAWGQDHPEIRALAGSILLRLEPDEMRQPTRLIPEGQPLKFTSALGLGLPAIYDAIVTRDLSAYIAINKRLTVLYPTVKSLALKNPTDMTKALGVQLHDGTFVGADFMSEGMLYYLAFAALPHLQPAAVILIEEPENGLHPARIREVIESLRELSNTTQILLATHSPLVVNELEPDEVTVITRQADEGTKGCLMRDTPNFAERSKVYALGELWVSYADGNFEEPLFTQPESAPPSDAPVEWSEGNKP